ncbi:hypothetical protein SAMN05216553_104256 [Lentzea fradiae]|uniref:Uncharacterized protein n=1 Tax=Lentzea fradiae TaxID=200378 RepID=A0A1G7Q4U7_9PSEU|nr:hypothetical protein [Lentzea fradiae]SDF93514.1 hypothetical protein SAMN05216553_104256 [Lentzea fradiae]
MQDDRGRVFREAWIAGVTKHFPGTPKDSYVKPWDDTDDWEKASATATYDQVVAFIEAGDGVTGLTREQKGRFVATCWLVQIYRNVADPKPSHVPDWNDMPSWWQQTDCDIFEAIERHIAR